MAERARAAGVALRPHFKTAKAVEVAARLQAAGAAGFAVSTLPEARALAAAGLGADLVWAVGLAPGRADEVVALRGEGVGLAVTIDNGPALAVLATATATATAAATAATAATTTLPIWLEVDCGYGRAGLRPDDPALCELAGRIVATATLELAGLLTHAGHSYACRDHAAVAAIAAAERDALLAAAAALQRAGLPRPRLSAGSTPTAIVGPDGRGGGWHGIDELRPGNYVFLDVAQHRIGVCTPDQIAVSVLASVIGHKPDADVPHLCIDAGSMALSPDGSAHAPAVAGDVDMGFGLVCDVDGVPLEGLRVGAVSQEHGWVVAAPGATLPWGELPIGAQVRVLPAHACLTAAMYAQLQVVEQGRVTASWPRVAGW